MNPSTLVPGDLCALRVSEKHPHMVGRPLVVAHDLMPCVHNVNSTEVEAGALAIVLEIGLTATWSYALGKDVVRVYVPSVPIVGHVFEHELERVDG